MRATVQVPRAKAPVAKALLQVGFAEVAAAAPPAWQPLPHQVPPPGDWLLWLLLGGRGCGKTAACAAYLDAHVNGPPCIPGYPGGHRPAIIAPTLGDALESCVDGPSGLKAHNPRVTSVQTTGGTFVRWPSGTRAKLFGSYTPEDVERLRAGGNTCLIWCEELAAWPKLDAAWTHMQLGLRLGPRPHAVASTTPKPRRLLKTLLADPTTVVTRAATADNPYLPERIRASFYGRYAGTRLGRQELAAELLTDTPGALWTYAMFEDRRPAPDLARVVVAIDPAVTATSESDDTGIVVAGLGVDGRGYVLADRSCRLSPNGWARRALAAYDTFHADRLVAEVNNGGDMVEATLRTVWRDSQRGGMLPYTKVHASRGKVTRAEPVAALYEQGRVSHVRVFEDLEEQLTTWTPESGTSPDRLDALVWALTWLLLDAPSGVEVGRDLYASEAEGPDPRSPRERARDAERQADRPFWD
jgi:predicted phage terminase large subunit-like protein